MTERPSRATLLIVGGTDASRETVARALERLGHVVIEARTDAEARQRVRERSIDVVILEASAPGLPCADLVRQLKADPGTSDLPILSLSASAPGAELAPQDLGTGADTFLTQPVAVDALAAVVGALVQLRRARQEAQQRAREVEEVRAARQRSEALLQRYRLLSEHAHDIMLFIRRDGRIMEANAAAVQAYGYSQEEFASLTIQHLRAGQAVYAVEQQMAAADQAGLVFETVHRRKNGSTFPVEVSSRGADMAGERVLLSIIRDITERKRAEEQLRRSEAILAQAGQMAHLGAWDIEISNWADINANPLTWSEEVYRIFGYEPGAVEVSNELFFSHVPPEDRERVVEAVAEATARREPYSVEHRIVRPDGTERIVQEHAEVVFDAAGRPVRIMGAVQDVTERRQAEEERAKLLETLNAEIAHRTKNNLAMAASMLQIQAGETQDEQAASVLRDAASRLITVAGIHEQLQATQAGEVDLLAALRQIGAAVQTLYGAEHVELSVTGEPLKLPSRDATNVAVAANELITNAAKHGCAGEPAQCEVRVQVEEEQETLRLSVWNSGAPLPADFELRHATGLGLRLVSSLVEGQYGGTFELRPAEGGTCAEITLPRPERRDAA